MTETLHIGDNIVLNDREIIGIFSGVQDNRGFLELHRESFSLRNETGTDRSFVLIERKKKFLVYYSKIGCRNLINRMKRIREEINGKETEKEKKGSRSEK